ncbi:MAG: hypothetical protein JW763_01745 [candidate division Zixibacteria bacterium]|nr:hypothetical protein [candidate division Zixibacteria bacterium]
MIRKAMLFAVLIVGCVITSAVADADIQTIWVTHADGETVFKVEAEGVFQYSHQLEEAKDGKPFRVVVDIFPAVHKLGQKSFYDLPKSVITAIRTSQYAVTPEKVVRLVLDLNLEAAYRIEKEGNWLYIYMPDKTAGAFADWCSSPVSKPGPSKPSSTTENKAVAVKPTSDQSSVSERVATPKVKPVVKPEPIPETAQKPTEEPSPAPSQNPTVAVSKPIPEIMQPKTASFYQAEQSRPWEAEMAQWKPVVMATPPPTVTNPPSKPPVEVAEAKVEEPAPQKSVQPESKPTMKPAPVQKVDTAVEPSQSDKIEEKKTAPAEPEQNDKPADGVKDKTFTKKKKTYSDAANDTNTESEVIADAKTESDDQADQKKSTSRFRRSPVMPAKLKGTIVAEFPTRMVIKYGAGSFRDPFKTLIDDTKQNDNPIDKRTPDVETLRLVGVLESESGKNRALLEDLDGYGYILKQGDKVKKGYVSRIDPNRAYFQLFEYGWSRTVALDLGDE